MVISPPYREKVDGESADRPADHSTRRGTLQRGTARAARAARIRKRLGDQDRVDANANHVSDGIDRSDPAGVVLSSELGGQPSERGVLRQDHRAAGARIKFKDRSRARLGAERQPRHRRAPKRALDTAGWDDWQNQIGASGCDRHLPHLLWRSRRCWLSIHSCPQDLKQPPLRLPWNDGESWYYTGGPHSGWGDLESWSAVDFSPSDTPGSCIPSRLWTIAAAPGKIVRVEHGRVMESLSNSDFQGSGWTVMYMHMATRGRVVAAGDGQHRRPDRASVVRGRRCRSESRAFRAAVQRRMDGRGNAADGLVGLDSQRDRSGVRRDHDARDGIARRRAIAATMRRTESPADAGPANP